MIRSEDDTFNMLSFLFLFLCLLLRAICFVIFDAIDAYLWHSQVLKRYIYLLGLYWYTENKKSSTIYIEVQNVYFYSFTFHLLNKRVVILNWMLNDRYIVMAPKVMAPNY